MLARLVRLELAYRDDSRWGADLLARNEMRIDARLMKIRLLG